MAWVTVQHLVLNRLTRRYGLQQTSDLLGVEYTIEVPPDTEFPKSFARFDVFARLFVASGRAVRLRLRVYWIDGPRGQVQRVHLTPSATISVTPDTACDCVLRLANLLLPGAGRYVIELRVRRRRPQELPSWQTLRREYFRVER
jgi:hypothetical protein